MVTHVAVVFFLLLEVQVSTVMALSPEIPVLYGSMSFFLTISHNIFLLYYVDMFVSVYRIDKVSFWIGEVS